MQWDCISDSSKSPGKVVKVKGASFGPGAHKMAAMMKALKSHPGFPWLKASNLVNNFDSIKWV